ncbi:MAG TPA: DUF2286 domain-containing protein [Fervidicoccus fontis]|uniref:DUF2286 domain-containing protein n=1 Tax=Fervidicoccus fontis TaxID=683846 RepID=A0A7C2UIU4_9CREN|nr:DUF2286 domain-containing protein [Fervidicoccus fontis]
MMPPQNHRCIVITAHSGKIKKKEVVDGQLEDVVKNVARDLLTNEWLPTFSDFMILRDSLEIELKAGQDKEAIPLYKEYGLKRTGKDSLTATIPIYLIVYESLKVSEDNYHDRGVAVVAPFIREADVKVLEELLEETTRKPSLEEISEEEKKIDLEEEEE